MFHSLADQLVRLDPGTPYNCHKSVRSAVVLNLLEQLETERIIWINEDEPIELNVTEFIIILNTVITSYRS